MMNENETEGDLFKNNAFQWCQTIGRLVGTSKLKQDLPHFGDDDNEELRDYLIVVDVHKEQIANPVVDRFKKLVVAHRLQRNDASGFNQTEGLSSDRLAPLKPRHLRRASTVGEATTRVLDLGKITRGRRRTESADDIIVVNAADENDQNGDQADADEVLSSERKTPAKPRHVRRATSVGEATVRVLDFVKQAQGHRRTGSARDIFSANRNDISHEVTESNTAPTHDIDLSVIPNDWGNQMAEADEAVASVRTPPTKPSRVQRATSFGEATVRVLDFVKIPQGHRRSGSARDMVSDNIASTTKPTA